LFRLEIWRTVIDYNIALSPVVGIGFVEWVRPWWMESSIDALWLNITMVFGLPGSILLFLVVVGSGVALTEKRTLSPYRGSLADKARLSVTMTLFFMALIGLTVHYWGSIWVFLGLITGARAGLTEDHHLESRREARERRLQQRRKRPLALDDQ
jgi:NADH:ubiquinone oxidoreductase subunit 2 (subunit N)